MGDRGVSDGELVTAALGGDPAGLGVLLERHRADMRAVAVARLGYGPGAEDAVQDAMMTALRRLGDLRDPEAVGPWLRAIVRNECRMQVRSARLAAPLDRDIAGADPGGEEVLERHALGDWVWHAVGQLSEPLQLVLVLRHFGGGRSYAEIAQICGGPVGTVRSRLNEGRRKLAEVLLAEADAAHGDAGSLARRRGDRLQEMLGASVEGGLAGVVADLAEPGMVMAGWWGAVPDAHDLLVRILSMDAEAGVRERVVDVSASSRFTVMDCELVSPPWDPTHCLPAVLWVVRMQAERIAGVRLCHPVAA